MFSCKSLQYISVWQSLFCVFYLSLCFCPLRVNWELQARVESMVLLWVLYSPYWLWNSKLCGYALWFVCSSLYTLVSCMFCLFIYCPLCLLKSLLVSSFFWKAACKYSAFWFIFCYSYTPLLSWIFSVWTKICQKYWFKKCVESWKLAQMSDHWSGVNNFERSRFNTSEVWHFLLIEKNIWK